MSAYVQLTDVVPGPNHYPIAGSLRATLFVDDTTGSKPVTLFGSMSLTFDGTATGHVTYSLGTTTRSCLMALQAPATAASCTP